MVKIFIYESKQQQRPIVDLGGWWWGVVKDKLLWL